MHNALYMYTSTAAVHMAIKSRSDIHMYMCILDSDGTYGVILRIVKAGCHLVAIAQVVEH